MKKIIILKASALAVVFAFIACNETFAVTQKATAQTPSSSQSYGCGAVYPTNVYCPTGQTCLFNAPMCIMSIAVGGSSITEALYNLNVPGSEFKILALDAKNGTKLPISTFPELGKRVAFQLSPKTGTFVGVPFNIVIQTELPTDGFINSLAQGIGKLTDQAQKDSANTLLETLKNFKATGQGINAIYRSVPALGETQYKLYHVRVPGTNSAEAYVMITPAGNLQFYENSDKPGVKNITEIDTGVLSK